MNYNRRHFIRTTGMVAAGSVVLPYWSCQPTADKAGQHNAAKENAGVDPTATGNLGAFGIQLYTLRSEMESDPRNVLKKVAQFGYNQVENYEGKNGLWWGLGHAEIKAICEDLGLSMVSSHCNFMEDFSTKAEQAAELSIRYLVAPWVGPQQSLDDFKRMADTFNQHGEVCKANGMRFAYHNHDYSFVELEGELPQDVMMQNTDPELVDFEMDIYWVVTAGEDPIQWLERYPHRFRLSHVKDRIRNAAPTDKEASCDLGTGSIDFTTILKKAKEQGMEYFLVEQERYDNTTPFDSARADALYMKSLVI